MYCLGDAEPDVWVVGAVVVAGVVAVMDVAAGAGTRGKQFPFGDALADLDNLELVVALLAVDDVIAVTTKNYIRSAIDPGAGASRTRRKLIAVDDVIAIAAMLMVRRSGSSFDSPMRRATRRASSSSLWRRSAITIWLRTRSREFGACSLGT